MRALVVSVNRIDSCSRTMRALVALLALLTIGIAGPLQATPMQCGGTAQPTCLNSLSLPSGKCVANGWTIDDPASAMPLEVAGVTDQGFGVSHANRFVGVDMYITHVAIQAKRPTAGQTTAILRVRFGDDISHGDLRPGAIIDTAIVNLPSSLISTDYTVVELDSTLYTMGSIFWIEMFYPTANGLCQGTREKNTPGVHGEAFVVSHESNPANETWVDYEDVNPDPGAYNDRAPVLRPLQLTDCARTCFIFVGGLDFQTSEDGDSVELECGITEQPLDTVRIDVFTSDGTEGVPRVTELYFDPTNWNVIQHFWVVGQDDALIDGDIQYHIQIAAVSVDSCYQGEVHQFTCENLDNDQVFLETVPVGNANNPNHNSGFGGVDHEYEIGKYEVTNNQYVEFLNAIASCDTWQLFDPSQATDPMGGIDKIGSCPTASYAVKPNMGEKPVNFVTLQDCMRFVNWLHNGKPVGSQDPTTTEDGVYDMSLGMFAVIPRQAGATWAIPTQDELFKAAFYDPVDPVADAGGTTDYWEFPTMSDGPATKATANSVGDISNPGADVINWDDGAIWNGVIGNVTTVGSAGPLSASHYGTYDQGGNIIEWTEDQFQQSGFTYGWLMGAGSHYPNVPTASAFSNGTATVSSQSQYIGLRVVKLGATGSGVCGDANNDALANITDAVYLIQYIFNGGPTPVPLLAGDVNCDGIVNITDAVYMIQYIFSGGNTPCDPDGNGVPDC